MPTRSLTGPPAVCARSERKKQLPRAVVEELLTDMLDEAYSDRRCIDWDGMVKRKPDVYKVRGP